MRGSCQNFISPAHSSEPIARQFLSPDADLLPPHRALPAHASLSPAGPTIVVPHIVTSSRADHRQAPCHPLPRNIVYPGTDHHRPPRRPSPPPPPSHHLPRALILTYLVRVFTNVIHFFLKMIWAIVLYVIMFFIKTFKMLLSLIHY